MPTDSRDLRDRVVRGLAKAGLVWALAVLGFVFTAGAAAGASEDPGGSHLALVGAGQAPSTAGLALALVVLAAGITVLVVGGLRTPPAAPSAREVPHLDEPADLSLSLGLAHSPYAPA